MKQRYWLGNREEWYKFVTSDKCKVSVYKYINIIHKRFMLYDHTKIGKDFYLRNIIRSFCK